MPEAPDAKLSKALMEAGLKLNEQFPGAAFVLLGSIETGGHSWPAFGWSGSCLQVIGLLDVGKKLVRDTMPENYR